MSVSKSFTLKIIKLMKNLKITSIFFLLTLFFVNAVNAQQGSANNTSDFLVYNVKKSAKTVDVNDKWNESGWKGIKSIKIRNYMGEIPEFKPKADVKMTYDDDFIYVIYRFKDRYVKSITEKINEHV